MNANLHDILRAHAPALEKIALDAGDGASLAYGELYARAGRMARALVALGVEPGDRVAAQIDKSPDMVVLALACLRAGAALLPLNTAYTLAELEYFLGDAEPALTLCRPDAARRLCARLREQLGLPAVESLGERATAAFAERIAADAGGSSPTVARGPRRSRRDPLHLGHDGPLQGRDADPRQPRLQRAGAGRHLALHRPTTC